MDEPTQISPEQYQQLQKATRQRRKAERAVLEAAIEWRKGGTISLLEKAIDRLIALG